MSSLFKFGLIPLVLIKPLMAIEPEATNLGAYGPTLIGTVTGLSTPQSVAASGTVGIVANFSGNSVTRFNLTNAQNLGNLTPFTGQPVAVAASGTNSVIASSGSNNNIFRFNISTGAFQGTISLSAFSSLPPAAIGINGNTICVGGEYNGSLNQSNIRFFSYSSGGTITSSVPTVTGQVKGIAVSGTYAAVVSQDTSTSYLSYINLSTYARISQNNIGGSVSGVALNGTVVAVSRPSGSSGVSIYSASNLNSAPLLGNLSTGLSQSVALSGTLGAAPDFNNKLLYFFNSSSTPPAILGTFPTGTGPFGVALSGTYGGVSNSNSTANNLTVFTTEAAVSGPPTFQLNNGAWSSGASWNTGVAPTSSDQAIMPFSGGPWTANLTAGGSAQYVSCLGTTTLQGNGTLTLNPLSGTIFDIQKQTQLTNGLNVNLIGSGTVNLVNLLTLTSASIQKQNSGSTVNVTINGTGTLSVSSSSNFDYLAGSSSALSSISVTGSGNLNVDNTSTFGRYAQTLTLAGPSVQNSGMLGSNAQNFVFSTGTMTNNGTCAYAANTLTISGGSITNANSLAEGDVATITLSAGKIINNGKFATKTVALGSKTALLSYQNPETISETVMTVNLVDPDYKKLNTESMWVDNQKSYELPVENLFGNQVLMASSLKALNQYCPPSTQKVIDKIFCLKDTDFSQALTELTPVFKIAQFSLEKLDFLIHKDLNIAFENENTKNAVFVTAGYDYLNQSKQSNYHGYDVSSFYQLLGVTASHHDVKYLAGLGAAESSMDVKGVKAHANYNTVYATVGLGSKYKKLSYSFDALFGYSFFRGQRNIQFLQATLKNNHNIYNISFDAEFAYDVIFKNCVLKPYDQLGYLWGQEDGYKEKGASGANLKIWDENISVLRNAFGFMFNVPKDKPVKGFIDLAWLYEWYIHSNTLKASIIGTGVDTVFEQALPTKNYGRIRAGLMGSHNKLSWQITYAGLIGEKFLENTASVRLGYKF